MNNKPKNLAVSKLLKLQKQGILKINYEYQRGKVWDPFQKKMFMDSILRGYPTPLIYFHEIKINVDTIDGNNENVHYEIIDGQQRIATLHEYTEGKFPLINIKEDIESRFPNFIDKETCDWSGKKFDALSDKHKNIILDTKLSVVFITSDENSDESIDYNKNEIRDLFIRLQSGLPLNDQEKRDAWPGNFTQFILKVGGKPELPKYPGHTFFPQVMGRSGNSRGNTRQIASILYMLYENYEEHKRFVDIKNKDVDNFYHLNIDFDESNIICQKFLKVLEYIKQVHKKANLNNLKNHLVYHLVIFIVSIIDYKWQDKFISAYSLFNDEIAKLKDVDEAQALGNEYYARYLQLTKSVTNSRNTIEKRHIFFMEKMRYFMRDDLAIEGNKDISDILEKEHIFFRDNKKCLMCKQDVLWCDAKIYHINPIAKKETGIKDAGLVHITCCPNNNADIEKANIAFNNKHLNITTPVESKGRSRKVTPILPAGTQARMYRKGEYITAVIQENNEWNINGAIEKSPSGAAREAVRQKTGRGIELNGYEVWEVKRPNDKNWLPLQSLRQIQK